MSIDIERLKVDESLWPEGAQYCCSLHQRFHEKVREGLEHWYIPRPTKPKATEWDGEGYPPVGHQCEIWLSPEAGYVPFVPDYYGKRFVVGRINEGREVARRLCKAKFRPLRTQRQIETEDLARDLLDDLDPLGVNLSGNTAMAIAVSLMNRGWHKEAKP